MERRTNYHTDVAIKLDALGKIVIGKGALTADEISSGQFSDAVMAIVTILLRDDTLAIEFSTKVDIFDKRKMIELSQTEIEEQKRIVDELWDLFNEQKKEV